MTESQQDFYRRLRTSVVSWAEGRGASGRYTRYLLLAPDFFHLLVRLSLDPRVPAADKAKAASAIAYFIAPVDLMPEALMGPAGYLDDVALAAFLLHRMVEAGQGAVAREHWAGDGDLLEVLRSVLAIADRALGSGLWKKLRGSV